MLKLCETCHCRGFIGRGGINGPRPTCSGSGFANATSAQAREAEIAETRGEVYELPGDNQDPYIDHLRQQVRDLADGLYEATA